MRPSIAFCSCTRSKWPMNRARCCGNAGGCSRQADACSRWCRTGAGCGRASIRPHLGRAAPTRAPRSRTSCATPGSLRSAGAKRSTFPRSHAAGSCARQWRGNGRVRRFQRHLPACTSSRRQSRSIAPFRYDANDGDSYRRSSRRWRPHPADESVAAGGIIITGPAAALLSTLEVLARTTMPAPPAMQREAIRLVIVAIGAVKILRRLLPLRLPAAGDEGRQPIDVVCVVAARLIRTRRILLMRRRERLRVARQIGLRLGGAERRLLSGSPRSLLLIPLLEYVVARPRGLGLGPCKMRIVLPELFLRDRNEPII